MARGINKVILIGNLGNDPDMRPMSGGQVANLSLATSESWSDKQTGERRERTEWHRVVAFGKLADIIGQYCRKGSKIYIEGRLQTRKWTDNQGIERYSTEVIANDMQMLDGRSGGSAPFDVGTGDFYNQPASRTQTQQPPTQPSNSYASAPTNTNQTQGKPNSPVQPQYGPNTDIDADFDDDIPF